MKKILFIINSLGGGGAEKALIEFLRHIDYTRYEVSLCLVFHEGCYLSDVPTRCGSSGSMNGSGISCTANR